MFANVGWGEMLVLVVVGLVILGPERLPGAIHWAANALCQARDYLTGVTNQLREDIGPEFDDLRGPLSELQKLRGMTPRQALTKHLLDGDDSLLTGNLDRPVNGAPATPVRAAGPAESNGGPAGPNVTPSAAEHHAPGQTPFDTDAT